MSFLTKTKKTALFIALSSSFITFNAHALSDELIQSCESCHGADGVSSQTDIPTISGIPEWNLSDQMLQYLDGRPAKTVNYVHGDTSQSDDMANIVESLSEDQIEALAAHYAELPFVRAQQPFDADLAAMGKELHDKSCARCHADGGSDPFDEASILAGQKKGYLLASMMEYKNGQRDADKGMVDAIKAMSDDEIKAVVEYYASYQ
ncbi:c-type cytochrome [Photobacterium lutimaris]|uniref:Cytochrome c-553 n=1 Tax=Photobacterium lutimaris TaxID=388278 RepID=A0A2T3IZ64_9GAMM|nr:c-type cytochrome [Photobacterium lutimaris]PSU33950.1 cytochrome c-553 [Photobacterium lutimaris]TDR76284.1 sulfide dehydrogenase cytochrome subunit [Photobacterium lutimaris]